MAGCGTNCGLCYGGNGSVSIQRARNLMKAGIDKVRAWKSATNGRGPWWNGGASHMNQAYPKNWFDRMGLVSLLDTQRRFQSVS